MSRSITTLIFLLFIISNCFGGWPIGKNRTVFGVGYNHYSGKRIYNSNWHLSEPGNSGDFFRSNYFSFSAEHGISRRLDLVGSISYLQQTANQNAVITKRNDMGDAMLGFAYSLENHDFTKYLTFQLSGIFPLYTNPDGNLPLGYAATGIDFSLNYNLTPSFLENKGYMMYQIAYRKYFTSDGPEQLTGDASVTFIIRKFQQLVFNLQGVGSFSTNTSININPNEIKNYKTGKLTVTYGRKLTRSIMLYGSAFYTFIGKNTVQGMGLGANMIIKIP
jgi:hypothetical protein